MKLLINFILFFLIGFSHAEAMVPLEAYTFDVVLRSTKFDKMSWYKIEEASYLLKLTLQTEEFKHSVLNHQFEGKKRFHKNSGLSNRKIYQVILEGAEELNNLKNNTFDAEIDFFTDFNSNVVGFTKTNTEKIWINKKYFYQFSPAELSGHLMHEWLHKLGFGHEKEKNEFRKFSVPYSVGNIVKKISKKLMDSNFYYGL